MKCDSYYQDSAFIILLFYLYMNVENHWQQLSPGLKIPDMKFRNTCENPNVLWFTDRNIKMQKKLAKVYNWNFLNSIINEHCYKLAILSYVPKQLLNRK